MSYGKYESVLQEEFGVDLPQMIQHLGHPGGVYGDTVLLLSRLVSHPEVTNVLETGSGLSTLALAKVAKDHAKNLITIEHDLHWAEVADSALNRAGLDFRVVATDSREVNAPDFGDLSFEIAWIDGCVFGHHPHERPDEDPQYIARVGGCNYYAQNLQKAVLIFDDAQAARREQFDRLADFFPGFHFDKFYWFNPTGRGDRHQAIFFPEGTEFLLDVVKEVEEL